MSSVPTVQFHTLSTTPNWLGPRPRRVLWDTYSLFRREIITILINQLSEHNQPFEHTLILFHLLQVCGQKYSFSSQNIENPESLNIGLLKIESAILPNYCTLHLGRQDLLDLRRPLLLMD